MVIVGGSFSKQLHELVWKYFYSSQTSTLWHSYLWTSLLAFGEFFEQTICMIILLSLLYGYKQTLCKGHILNWHNFISLLFQLELLRLQFDHLLSVPQHQNKQPVSQGKCICSQISVNTYISSAHLYSGCDWDKMASLLWVHYCHTGPLGLLATTASPETVWN